LKRAVRDRPGCDWPMPGPHRARGPIKAA
jgi:hypothetical protein